MNFEEVEKKYTGENKSAAATGMFIPIILEYSILVYTQDLNSKEKIIITTVFIAFMTLMIQLQAIYESVKKEIK